MIKMVTKEQMQWLESLVPQMKTIRYGPMEPFFYQTVEQHVIAMLGLVDATLGEAGLQFDADLLRAMIIVHDLPEIGMEKDITAWELERDAGLAKYKEIAERAVMQRFAEEQGQWVLDIYNECEEGKTDIARFVKFLDKYESNVYLLGRFELQGTELGQTGEHIYYNTRRLVKAAVGFPAVMDVARRRMEEIRPLFEKYGILDKWQELSFVLL